MRNLLSIFAIAGAAALLALPACAQTPAPLDHSKMDHSKPDTPKADAPAMDHSKMGHKMDHSKMDKMGKGTKTDANDTPSTAAYKAANHQMHVGMDIKFSGDADVDFVKGMIPHHLGAVDMAKVVLKHGKDPELKKLAAEIVVAQDKEIAFMQAWLKAKGK
jgi:uncharacterized protein (DUF305 family)